MVICFLHSFIDLNHPVAAVGCRGMPTHFHLPPSTILQASPDALLLLFASLPPPSFLQAGADARSALTDAAVRQLVLDRRYCALAALEQAGRELFQDLGPSAWGLQLEPAGLTSFVGPGLPLARGRMLVEEGLCRRLQALGEETAAAAVTTTVDALTVTCSSSGSR